jgi:two-component system, chemotaxis family, sensor kinase CheA
METSSSHLVASGEMQLERLRELTNTIEGLDPTVRTVHRLASAIQTEALRLRMVPVGPFFRRFERVLRDACRSTGHEARLVITGEQTELDKKLIDQLIDPITHLLRNAVDHGLESPADRQQAGKPRRGTIALEARQESGRVIITVSDDGRGIDAERLRAAIIEKGLLAEAPAKMLTDREAIAYIFQSGFSTASRLTDISGRGVGLDIVRSRITALSGSVEVETEIGAGTSFVVTLPLTLAMVRSLLIESGGARYALPLHAIKEVVQIVPENIRNIGGAPSHLAVKRELLPMVAIGPPGMLAGKQWAVLARTEDVMIAIIVDRVLREEELVVKPIPPYLRGVNGSSGATILGDGSIALFLDIAPLLARHQGQAVAQP